MGRVHSTNWGIYTEENSKTIILMADYVTKGKMEIRMMENGEKVKNMVTVSTNGLMAASMRVIMSMARSMVKVK